MPVTLPNGLVCPERSDNPTQACEQIKDLFVVVDELQSAVAGELPNQVSPKICQDISKFNWQLVSEPTCKVFCQNVTVPLGVSTDELIYTIYNANGAMVNLCVEVVGPNAIKLTTNNPEAYKVVYA